MSNMYMIDELFERAQQPSHQLQRIKPVSNNMLDAYVMQAIKGRKRSVKAVASHLHLSEEKLMDNLNPELFSVSDTGLGNKIIGLTPAALGM